MQGKGLNERRQLVANARIQAHACRNSAFGKSHHPDTPAIDGRVLVQGLEGGIGIGHGIELGGTHDLERIRHVFTYATRLEVIDQQRSYAVVGQHLGRFALAPGDGPRATWQDNHGRHLLLFAGPLGQEQLSHTHGCLCLGRLTEQHIEVVRTAGLEADIALCITMQLRGGHQGSHLGQRRQSIEQILS